MFTIPIPEAVFERCSDELNSINVSAQKVQERFFRNGQVEYRFSLTEDGSYVLRLYAIK